MSSVLTRFGLIHSFKNTTRDLICACVCVCMYHGNGQHVFIGIPILEWYKLGCSENKDLSVQVSVEAKLPITIHDLYTHTHTHIHAHTHTIFED